MKSKSPTALDVLKYMRRLLRKGWTQDVAARSASNRPVDVASPKAAKFCLWGAEQRAGYDLEPTDRAFNKADSLIRRCIKEKRKRFIAIYNDMPGRTQKEILSVVSCAIKKAEGN